MRPRARATLRTAGPALLVGLLAFVLTVEWRSQGRAADQVRGRREALARVIEERQRRTDDLERRLGELRARLDAAAARSGGELLGETRALTEQAARLSGATPVSGPGLVVTLGDAQGAGRSTDQADFRIQDVDIQAVVNALWGAGAEAIAVSGQRIVSTTAIRNAGAAVLVNYRVLASPYRIQIVGDAPRLRRAFEASDIARRFRTWSDVYGLGFSISHAETLTLPAFTGSLRFRYATAIDDGEG